MPSAAMSVAHGTGNSRMTATRTGQETLHRTWPPGRDACCDCEEQGFECQRRISQEGVAARHQYGGSGTDDQKPEETSALWKTQKHQETALAARPSMYKVACGLKLWLARGEPSSSPRPRRN